MLFEKLFLDKFYEIQKNHKINDKKKSFTFGYRAFVSFLIAFKTYDETYLTSLFLMRHKKKPQLRERQFAFIEALIKLSTEFLKIELGINQNGIIDCPVDYTV